MLHFLIRINTLFIGVVFVLTIPLYPVRADNMESVSLTLPQQKARVELEEHANDLKLNWSAVTQTPNFVRVKNLDILWSSGDKVQRAYQFINEYKDLFQINEPYKEFQFEEQTGDSFGMEHVTLQQVHHGVPVYASRLSFHFEPNGNITSINGIYVPQLANRSSEARISKTEAVNLAKDNLMQQLELTKESFDQLNIQDASSGLIYYNHGLFSKRREETYLTWRISLHSDRIALNKLFYINTVDGTVINQLDNLFTAKDRETYVFADCLDYYGTLTYNESGLVDAYDEQAETVHEYAGVIYDYYNTNFGRDSYDDSGGLIESYTRYEEWNADLLVPGCDDYANAYWDPARNIMIYGENFLALDVAAHETTHGLIQYSVGTTDDDTLEYEGESGALNESYADIFGELIELDNGGAGEWKIGEDVAGIAGRDFADPNMGAYDRTQDYNAETNYGQPAHVDEKSEVTDPYCSSIGGDNGCLHLNSGITNNVLYLLIEGGTNPYSGQTVTGGVPREAVGQIYYRALTTYLDVSSNFDDAYNATMQSCLDLNADDSTAYPLSYCEAVFDAFAAVGINTDSSYLWANISATTTSGYGPLTITFDGADSRVLGSTITNYAWDFDDGSTATGGAVSHTFSDPGSYLVTLTVTAADGSTSDTQLSVVIYADPTISTNTTWTTDRSPYVITSLTVQSGVTLTIDPGVVIKLNDASSNIVINGTLVIDGTATNTVTMTSSKDDTIGGDTNNDASATTPAAGDWRSMRVAAGGSLYADYLTMQYGGNSATAMLLIDDYANTVWLDHNTYLESGYYLLQLDPNSTSTVQNSTFISTAGEYGIYQTGGTLTFTGNTVSSQDNYGFVIYSASPTITNSTFTHSNIGLYVAGASIPTIVNNTFTENSLAMRVDQPTGGLTITGNTGSDNNYNTIGINGSLAGDMSWNMDNGLLYMIMGSVSVPAGTTLTIDPGTTIKSWDTSSYLSVAGTLQAVGTSGAPIILTSIKDDASGGDSNSDGSATTASPGDWRSIDIASGGSAQLDYVTVQYGGHGAAMFLVDDHANAVNIDHSTLQTSAYYGLQIDPDSTSTIQSSTITGSGSADAVYINGGTTTLSDNTISAASHYALTIVNGSPVITGNVFTDSLGGIQVAGASSVPTVTDNTIYNNSYGMQLGTNATANIMNNAITNNSSYGIYSSGPTTVTAMSNWWGTATGPYHATLNPSGTGNAVSDDVDFDPWLSADPTPPDTTPPGEVTLGTIQRDVWNRTITLRWTNPTDADFDHVRIDRTTVATGVTTTISTSSTRTRYTDTTAAYNTNYIYTLYSYDTAGNVSAGVSSSSQRVMNPAPTGLTLTPGDTTITAAWTASAAPAASLAGYKVYYGTSPTALTSVVDVGVTTSTTLTGLTNGTLYYVAVTARSTAGVESGRSPVRSIRPRP